MEEGWKNLDFLGAAGWWQAGGLRMWLGFNLEVCGVLAICVVGSGLKRRRSELDVVPYGM